MSADFLTSPEPTSFVDTVIFAAQMAACFVTFFGVLAIGGFLILAMIAALNKWAERVFED